MRALYDEIPRIRAERLLDAAQAASFPHLDRTGQTRWLQSVGRVSSRAAMAAGKSLGGLTWNGQVVPTREGFTRRLAMAFGGGLPGQAGSPAPIAAPRSGRLASLPRTAEERVEMQALAQGTPRPTVGPPRPRLARHPAADWAGPAPEIGPITGPVIDG